MPEEKVPLPRSSYDELVKIIKAYGRMSTEAPPKEVAKLAAMNWTIVSANNAFLVAIGIVAGGKKKAITDQGRTLSLALTHDIEEEVSTQWQEIVKNNEFLNNLVAAVSIRKGMDSSALQTHVAYSAGLPKNKGVMTGANTVIEILKHAALLKEMDGKLLAAPERQAYTGEKQEIVVSGGGGVEVGGAAEISLVPGRAPASVIPVSIQIQIQCPASEIESLATRLKCLLKELAKDREAGD